MYHFRMRVPNAGYCWLDTAMPCPLNGGRLGAPPYMSVSLNQDEARAGGEVQVEAHSTVVEYDNSLFLTFKDLPLDREAILTFANARGWIGPTGAVHDGRGVIRQAVDMATWRREIRDVWTAVHLWGQIQANDRVALKRYFLWHPTELRVRFSQDIVLLDRHGQTSRGGVSPAARVKVEANGRWLISTRDQAALTTRGLEHGDDIGAAKLAVQELVNARLHRLCRPVLSVGPKLEFKGLWSAANLLGALWLQVYLAVIRQAEHRRCDICGEAMDVSAHRSNKRVHATCSKRLSMRKWRASQKQPGSKPV